MNQEQKWLLQEKYTGVENDAFYADCKQLEAGVPLAYLIGQVPFLDCTIHLDSHPLIPRPETEYWVELAITTIKSVSSRRNIVLDLCAGSGAIGVAVAKAIPSAQVTFAEIDPGHLPTIEKNIALNIQNGQTTKIIESDLFSAITPLIKFDYILTNPPYIDAAAHTIDENVALNEPHLALFGGAHGMDIITRIIETTPTYLNPDGQLWIEHEPAQVEAIFKLGMQNGYTAVTHPDQYGVPRFSILSVAQ